MRLNFISDEKPKKLAKEILKVSNSVKLVDCQNLLAQASGYRDWHDLTRNCVHSSEKEPFLTLKNSDNIIEFILEISNITDANAGEILTILTRARVLEIDSFFDALKLREALFAQMEFKSPGKRQPGEIGRTKMRGEKSKTVILKEKSHVMLVIAHNAVSCAIADFEYVSPRLPQKFLGLT